MKSKAGKWIGSGIYRGFTVIKPEDPVVLVFGFMTWVVMAMILGWLRDRGRPELCICNTRVNHEYEEMGFWRCRKCGGYWR